MTNCENCRKTGYRKFFAIFRLKPFDNEIIIYSYFHFFINIL